MTVLLNAVAFVDTNMRRVLHRLFIGPEIPQATATEGGLLALAAALVPPGGGWEWNQALMELGALVCTARKPRCEACPVAGICRARTRISDALAGVPRGTKATYRYEDSNRFYRGRVLAKLREAPDEGVALHDLGAGLREGFTDEDLPWIHGVVQSLEKDGLAVVSGERPTYGGAGYGGADAVAESRPSYGTDNDAKGRNDASGETRARLP